MYISLLYSHDDSEMTLWLSPFYLWGWIYFLNAGFLVFLVTAAFIFRDQQCHLSVIHFNYNHKTPDSENKGRGISPHMINSTDTKTFTLISRRLFERHLLKFNSKGEHISKLRQFFLEKSKKVFPKIPEPVLNAPQRGFSQQKSPIPFLVRFFNWCLFYSCTIFQGHECSEPTEKCLSDQVKKTKLSLWYKDWLCL